MIKIDEKYHMAYISDDTYENVRLAFSTKHGGVSLGHLSSMNMSFNRGDAEENVKENYRRLLEVLGLSSSDIYICRQVHGNRVRVIRTDDEKTGYLPEAEYDAEITDRKNVVLTAVHADCVPLLFYDDVKKCIGAAHSGWRGTVSEVAYQTVRSMEREYGCEPGNIKVWIGPHICKSCFIVREDVYGEFSQKLPWSEEFFTPVGEGRYEADMGKIIRKTLENCGVISDNIKDMELCTSCNEGLFYSHRRDKGKTGAMVGLIAMV